MGARRRGSAGVQGHRIGLGARGQAGVSPRFHLATSPTSSSSSPTARAAPPPGGFAAPPGLVAPARCILKEFFMKKVIYEQ